MYDTDHFDTFYSNRGTSSAKVLLAIGLVYCLIAAYGINAPYTNAFHERQNQVAEISRNIYHLGLQSSWQPRVRFANPVYPVQGYSVVRLEFPFHGILSSLLYPLVGEAPWVGRTISVLLALLAFGFSFRVYAGLSDETAASYGLVIFAFAPLTLQCGQVPMPDIVCTLGMIGSMALALSYRTNGERTRDLVSSALFFTFSMLGKPSIFPYVLPILVCLTNPDRGVVYNSKRLAPWLVLAFALPVVWTGLSAVDPVGSQSSINMARDPVHKSNLTDLTNKNFYIRIFSYLTLFGVGPIGVMLAAIGFRASLGGRLRSLAVAIALSTAFVYFAASRLMWREPQYTLPVLFWLGLFSSIGVQVVRRDHPAWIRKPTLVVPLVLLQVAGVVVGTLDLRSDRYPHYGDLVKIRQVLPPEARLVQVSESYGATPTFALSRETVPFGGRAVTIGFSPAAKDVGSTPSGRPLDVLRKFHNLGYNYLVFIDYTYRGSLFGNRRKWVRGSDLEQELYREVSRNFNKIFESEHVVLFELSPEF